MTINVYEVSNKREFDIFIRMPGVIYYNDPFWFPPPPHYVLNEIMQIPSEKLLLLVAVQDNDVVGRTAGIINRHHEKNTALFGYFESINDQQVAKKLITGVEEWALNKGFNYLTGPVNINTNDSVGLLVEGFNQPPKNGMPYNPSYYRNLLEGCGFNKHLDLLAYRWTDQHLIPERLARIAAKVRNNKKFLLRTLNLRNIHREAEILSAVHNQTMQDNWGSENLSVSEAANYLAKYRKFADPDLLLAAEVNNEPAGICLALPETDISSPRSCRVAVLAVVPKFRQQGIAAVLIYEMGMRLLHKGYKEAELSLVMENNTMVNRLLQSFNLKVTKRFRLYKKNLI
ncbi:MAG: GNAT family N-acetyltransferase [Desulfotomaculum sp.]|nr:GNAT family N-acetyltransferase [Desulfotomaculum sp.]